MFIASGMVEHEAAASKIKRNFPPIYKLIKQLKDAKNDRASLFDKLESKFDELGVEVNDVNDARKVIAHDCLAQARIIRKGARAMNQSTWARPQEERVDPTHWARGEWEGIDWGGH